jgi:putative aminopeptidase FrvX
LAIPQVLHDLLSARGPSGYESEAAAVWREAASVFADVSSDTLGSSFARVKGTGDGPVLVVVGHIDEIGLIVTHIDDQGLVWFRGVGGWSPETLVGQRLEILTHEGTVPAVVARDRPKPRKPGEERRPLELEQLHIDIGARDGDDARARVRPGDVAVIAAARSSCRTGGWPRGRSTTDSAPTSRSRRHGSWPRAAMRSAMWSRSRPSRRRSATSAARGRASSRSSRRSRSRST